MSAIKQPPSSDQPLKRLMTLGADSPSYRDETEVKVKNAAQHAFTATTPIRHQRTQAGDLSEFASIALVQSNSLHGITDPVNESRTLSVFDRVVLAIMSIWNLFKNSAGSIYNFVFRRASS